MFDNDGAEGSAVVVSGTHSDVTMMGAVLQHDAEPLKLTAGATANVTNCTFDGTVRLTGNSLLAGANCIVTDGFNAEPASTAAMLTSLFPGAAGGNIDGHATFVNAAARDYRLAAGSLGIDAANMFIFEDANGAFVDVVGGDRLVDDPDTHDTGFGALSYLDIGAHEFQAATTTATCCPGDMNGDGILDGLDTQLFVLALLGGALCP